MIQELIQRVIAALISGFAGQVTNPATRILAGPIAAPNQPQRPRWAVESADLEYVQTTGDDSSGQPRALEARERHVVGMLPAGPYTLSNTLLEGSLQVRVIFDEGLVAERSFDLLPGVDFTFNSLTNDFLVTKDITGAIALRVKYSFVGNATLREFVQNFHVTVYLDDWADSDRFLGLTMAILQSRHAAFLDQFNFQSPTSFTANGFTCLSMIQKIRMLRMEQLPRAANQALADIQLRLHFSVSGHLRLGETLSGGFGIISKIHTPDESGDGVNIVPGLG